MKKLNSLSYNHRIKWYVINCTTN